MRHTREDDFTGTVDGAAAHAALLDDAPDDRPDLADLADAPRPPARRAASAPVYGPFFPHQVLATDSVEVAAFLADLTETQAAALLAFLNTRPA